jgi:hypothetical protein
MCPERCGDRLAGRVRIVMECISKAFMELLTSLYVVLYPFSRITNPSLAQERCIFGVLLLYYKHRHDGIPVTVV